MNVATMTIEELKPDELTALEELIQKSLEITHKALGIETASHQDELSELVPHPKTVSSGVLRSVTAKKYINEQISEESDENLRYLAAKRAELEAISAELSARFAKNRAKFIRRRFERETCSSFPPHSA